MAEGYRDTFSSQPGLDACGKPKNHGFFFALFILVLVNLFFLKNSKIFFWELAREKKIGRLVSLVNDLCTGPHQFYAALAKHTF